MRHEVDLLLAETVPQVAGHRERVGDELFQRHRFRRDAGTVGKPRTPLFPPGHREIVLQPGGVPLREEVLRHPPCRKSSTGCAGSLLWMNIPCRMPLMLTKTFSEMLPGGGRPFSSRRGLGPARPSSFSAAMTASVA